MPEPLRCMSPTTPELPGQINVYIERVRNDSLLADAGVPLAAGDFYYGMHLNVIEPEQSVVKTLVTGLVVMALAVDHVSDRWNTAQYGEAPCQVVGVTHMSLAHLAIRAGFALMPIDAAEFLKPDNAAVKWDKYYHELAAFYENHTGAGRKGSPLELAVVHQPVESLVARWHMAYLDEKWYGSLLLEQLGISVSTTTAKK